MTLAHCSIPIPLASHTVAASSHVWLFFSPSRSALSTHTYIHWRSPRLRFLSVVAPQMSLSFSRSSCGGCVFDVPGNAAVRCAATHGYTLERESSWHSVVRAPSDDEGELKIFNFIIIFSRFVTHDLHL